MTSEPGIQRPRPGPGSPVGQAERTGCCRAACAYA